MRKSAPWKVAIAAYLKATTDVSNPWLATQLNMGSPFYVTGSKRGRAAVRRHTAAGLSFPKPVDPARQVPSRFPERNGLVPDAEVDRT